MQQHDRYRLIGVGNEPAAVYESDPATAFLSQFRNHILEPEQAFARDGKLRRSLDEQLHRAHQVNCPESLHVLHVCLNEILYWRFNAGREHIEHSSLIFEIQQNIIVAQLETDLRQIDSDSLPETAESFERWFEAHCRLDGQNPHPLFGFLELRANLSQFRRFIEVEAGVHVSFDDVIALAQIGVRGVAKEEFLHNLQDELGNGNDKHHLTMFERLVNGLGIHAIQRRTLPWEALVCGSYMMFLAYFRHFYPYCIGYLGFLEALTPTRFGCIARGGIRLGVGTSLLDYHAEHSELDTEHAQGWLYNIILPAIREHGAQMSRDIAAGVCLRDLVAKRYWDAMLTELITQPTPN